MNRSRKRKNFWTNNYFSEYEPKLKRIKTELPYKTKKKHNKVIRRNSSALIANVSEIRIILDRTIVDKYFQAKQMLREILSTRPLRIAYRRNDKKSKKQTSLFDYMQVNNDVTKNDNQIYDQIKKESSNVIDQNNISPTYDVNIIPQPAQIMYYMGNNPSQTNCFMMDNRLVILPSNAQFTPEEFIYNNYGFIPVMRLPQIKTQFHKDLPVKEEINDTSMNSSVIIYDHTIPNIEDIAATSTPIVKDIHNEPTLINCYSDEETQIIPDAKCDISIFNEKAIKLEKSDDETKFTPIKFDKRGRLICSRCNRSFKLLETFKQHKLHCELEFLYECLYCDYSAKIFHVFKKHVVRMHKDEVENEGLERILMKIQKRRMDKKTLLLISKESEVESNAEESFVKSIENKFIPSKLTFDLFCLLCKNRSNE